jgi:hypothetical protein
MLMQTPMTPPTNRPQISIGDQVFLEQGGEEIGAVRGTKGRGLLVYVEGSGDFVVPVDAIRSARYGKIVLDAAKLDERFLEAAHESETL